MPPPSVDRKLPSLEITHHGAGAADTVSDGPVKPTDNENEKNTEANKSAHSVRFVDFLAWQLSPAVVVLRFSVLVVTPRIFLPFSAAFFLAATLFNSAAFFFLV